MACGRMQQFMRAIQPLLPLIPIGIVLVVAATIAVGFWRSRTKNSAIAQMLSNLVLFAPLGVFAPLRWHRLDGFVPVLAGAAAFSAVVEIAQFILGGGRQTSVTDVIMNTAGALIGYIALRLARSGMDWRARDPAHCRDAYDRTRVVNT
jgi:glycopeptide antibiotics resistance protein